MRHFLATLLAASILSAGLAADAGIDAAIRDAITAAVRARMGEGVEVAVDAVRVQGEWTHASPHARLAPGTRLGRTMRLSLGAVPERAGAGVAWTGAAEADVRVVVEHLHAARAIVRGEFIGDADVTVTRHEVEGTMRPWPTADAANRSRTLRDVAAGTCLGPGTLAMLPLVRAGQDVLATVLIAEVRAEATLLAADNGELGAIVRVVNPQSRRSLKARVTGPGKVEVIP
jgi:flagella basal body P-ring formation protein FlgA